MPHSGLVRRLQNVVALTAWWVSELSAGRVVQCCAVLLFLVWRLPSCSTATTFLAQEVLDGLSKTILPPRCRAQAAQPYPCASTFVSRHAAWLVTLHRRAHFASPQPLASRMQPHPLFHLTRWVLRRQLLHSQPRYQRQAQWQRGCRRLLAWTSAMCGRRLHRAPMTDERPCVLQHRRQHLC